MFLHAFRYCMVFIVSVLWFSVLLSPTQHVCCPPLVLHVLLGSCHNGIFFDSPCMRPWTVYRASCHSYVKTLHTTLKALTTITEELFSNSFATNRSTKYRLLCTYLLLHIPPIPSKCVWPSESNYLVYTLLFVYSIYMGVTRGLVRCRIIHKGGNKGCREYFTLAYLYL